MPSIQTSSTLHFKTGPPPRKLWISSEWEYFEGDKVLLLPYIYISTPEQDVIKSDFEVNLNRFEVKSVSSPRPVAI